MLFRCVPGQEWPGTPDSEGLPGRSKERPDLCGPVGSQGADNATPAEKGPSRYRYQQEGTKQRANCPRYDCQSQSTGYTPSDETLLRILGNYVLKSLFYVKKKSDSKKTNNSLIDHTYDKMAIFGQIN